MTLLDGKHSPVQVWAVEDTSIQLTWGFLPEGPLVAHAGSVEVRADHGGGPGAMLVDGLAADSPVTIELAWNGGSTALETRTLSALPGEELTRFATISDLHLGARKWGAFNTVSDPSGHPVPHPFRCARAAVAEAVAWGAQLLIIKGDAVQHETDADFAQLAELVDQFPDLPMLLIPGNHEVDGRSGTIPLTVGDRELVYTRKVESFDLPGIRILVGDTTVPGNGRGTLVRTGPALLAAARESDRPMFMGLHHQLQPTRLPRHWPVGISAPESTDFLDQLHLLNQPITVSSGHTHRNRARYHGDVLVTEVASTKDWPGVWAGYTVHEGGMRQTVRRTMRPDAIAWTEYSRVAVGGLWAKWSPGPMSERCISRTWSGDRSLIN